MMDVTVTDEGITLSDGDVVVMTLSKEWTEGLSLVAYLDGELVHLYLNAACSILRKRDYLDIIEKEMTSLGHRFGALHYGRPIATQYRGEWWYGLGNALIISNTGTLSPICETAIRVRDLPIPNSVPLLDFVHTYILKQL